VSVKDNVISNLYVENKKENIWFGVSFSSIFSRSSSIDPYMIRINNIKRNNNLLPSYFSNKHLDIDTSFNKDVFDVLIQQIIDHGEITLQ
jgi:hypothetical protein